MKEQKGIPLSILLENGRTKILGAINTAINDSKLPAFLVEGIITEALSQVRSQKNIELAADYNATQVEPQKEE